MEIFFWKLKFFFFSEIALKLSKSSFFFNICGIYSFLNRTLGLRKSFLNQTYVLKKLVVATIFLKSRFFLKSNFLKSRFHCTNKHIALIHPFFVWSKNKQFYIPFHSLTYQWSRSHTCIRRIGKVVSRYLLVLIVCHNLTFAMNFGSERFWTTSTCENISNKKWHWSPLIQHGAAFCLVWYHFLPNKYSAIFNSLWSGHLLIWWTYSKCVPTVSCLSIGLGWPLFFKILPRKPGFVGLWQKRCC